MSIKSGLIIVLILCSICPLASYATQANSPDKLKLALIVPETANFWQRINLFSEKAASDLNTELVIFDAESQGGMMLEHARAAIALDVDGVIFTSFRETEQAILEILDRAEIPSIIINTLPEDLRLQPRKQYKHWLGSITPDDKLAGYILMAELHQMARKNGMNTKVLAINGNMQDIAARHRVFGLSQYHNEHQLDSLDIVEGNWNPVKAKQAFVQALAKNPDISIVWAASDGMAQGVSYGISQINMKTRPFVGGIDWSPDSAEQLRIGMLKVSVGGHFLDGAWAVILLHDFLQGIDFAKQQKQFISTMAPVTADNIDQYDAYFSLSPRNIDFKSQSRFYTPEKQNANLDFLASLLEESKQTKHNGPKSVKEVKAPWLNWTVIAITFVAIALSMLILTSVRALLARDK